KDLTISTITSLNWSIKRATKPSFYFLYTKNCIFLYIGLLFQASIHFFSHLLILRLTNTKILPASFVTIRNAFTIDNLVSNLTNRFTACFNTSTTYTFVYFRSYFIVS